MGLLQIFVHHEGVDVSLCGMLDCVGERTGDVKALLFPEVNGCSVGGDDEVVLHRAVAAG